jgi:hypothetical protein
MNGPFHAQSTYNSGQVSPVSIKWGLSVFQKQLDGVENHSCSEFSPDFPITQTLASPIFRPIYPAYNFQEILFISFYTDNM